MAQITITIDIEDDAPEGGFQLERWQRSHGAERGTVLARIARANQSAGKPEKNVLAALADAVLATS